MAVKVPGTRAGAPGSPRLRPASLLVIGCVTLGKQRNLSEPMFSLL